MPVNVDRIFVQHCRNFLESAKGTDDEDASKELAGWVSQVALGIIDADEKQINDKFGIYYSEHECNEHSDDMGDALVDIVNKRLTNRDDQIDTCGSEISDVKSLLRDKIINVTSEEVDEHRDGFYDMIGKLKSGVLPHPAVPFDVSRKVNVIPLFQLTRDLISKAENNEIDCFTCEDAPNVVVTIEPSMDPVCVWLFSSFNISKCMKLNYRSGIERKVNEFRLSILDELEAQDS